MTAGLAFKAIDESAVSLFPELVLQPGNLDDVKEVNPLVLRG